MILYFNHLEAPYICVFDIEHDQCELVQFAGLLFKRIGDGLYQLSRNLNLYVEHKITPFFKKFSKISQSFLDEYGVSKEDAKETLHEFLDGIPKEHLLLVSHGVYQDNIILNRNDIKTEGYNTLCTYELAKKVTGRLNHLTVHDLCNECGCVGIAEHNAYSDAFMTACILSFLLKQGDENYEDVES